MQEHILSSRFTYRVDYVPKKCQNFRCVFLNGEIPVAIREVDAAEAPFAYGITSFGPDRRDEVQVRSFDGALWWPVAWQSDPLKASHLLAWSQSDWPAASALLDPMHRTYHLPGPSADEFFENMPTREDKFVSTREDQSKGAERDASRVIFCEGRVLVDAGDPVWYAIFHAPSRSIDLFIGHSALDRPDRAGFSTPGPDRGIRMTSARRSRAFGLGEMAFALRTFAERDYEVQFRSEIAALSDRAPSPAADLCARAFAQYIWEIAWRYPDLRKVMPAVANARGGQPPPEALPHREMLEQLVSFEDAVLKKQVAFLATDAHQIRDRLNSHEPLSEKDEAVLLALGAG